MKINPIKSIQGKISLPGDKSITHRAIILSALTENRVIIRNPLISEDTLATLNGLSKLGVHYESRKDMLIINGEGLKMSHARRNCTINIDCGNSGSTMRFLAGLLSGLKVRAVLTGDSSLSRRPMQRIISPLSLLGARIYSENNDGHAPLLIEPAHPSGKDIRTSISSAEVKTSILLAGLLADGKTSITEPMKSRDHTERMLFFLHAPISLEGNKVSIYGHSALYGDEISVPGDISSAAYFLALALILPESRILIKNCGINPTRTGLLDSIRKMGGKIRIFNKRMYGCEPVADIEAESSMLHGISIGSEDIPSMIDELPVLSVLAAYSSGVTIVRGAGELRKKESDRINLIISNLKKMNVACREYEDGFEIEGIYNSSGEKIRDIKGADIETEKDHRIAMAFTIACLAASSESDIRDSESVSISYPDFYKDLKKLIQQ